MSRIVMSIEENGIGQVLGKFDLSEHYHRIYNKAIDDFEDMLWEWANNHQGRLDRMDVINIANRLKEQKNDKSI